MPMMMTAAGTVPAARVFVMGAGVAGLQAIATARRLGAVVTATDVRPAAKEQVESLGAKFIAVEDEEFKQAETAGGYAKEMSDEYQAKQAALVAEHIAKQDIVITTALIPGRPAPKLVSGRWSRVDEARLGDRRSRGRARRQRARAGQAGRGGRRRRRQDRRLPQRARPARGHRLERSTPRTSRLRRDPDRQGTRRHSRQLGRRTRQGTAADARRRDRHPNFAEIGGRQRHGRAEPATRRPRSLAKREAGRRRAAQEAREAAESAQGPSPMPRLGAAHRARRHRRRDRPVRLPFAIFVLAIFVGYYVVWSVTPALHTPLMSVTNAISSVIVVGALLAVGVSGGPPSAGTLGAHLRLHRAGARLGQHLRRLPRHPAHARHVQEEGLR
jgi:hypothetical protein